MSQIILSHISKFYGSETALEDVSLAFEDGVTTAVVGRSGGGKSTLLQLINGLVRPDSGDIRVFEKEIDYNRLPALRRRIGYAVQGTGLFPHQTVRDNITLLARLEGWAPERISERKQLLMQLVELPPEYEQRYPHELSGGQQQRVGLCRAMMLDPPLFLLDEPFGALDPITRGEVRAEFARLQDAAPRTTVLVTHDIREAVVLASHLVVLERGRVLQHGPTEEVVNRPAHETVRELLATGLRDGGGQSG